ncbi:MAG TPA: YetF domain-containing protein [Chloroflexia bacterium]|nr:YetF domain-containing protein [Chloroflexia bacterium]
MLQELWEQLQALFGLGAYAETAGPLQSALRTVLVYVSALALVRLGSKRFLSQATAFDVIVAIMLGSIMSRAADGSSPFLPTLLIAGVLVGVHWLFALLAYHTSWFGNLVKGQRVLLIKDGEVQQDGMRRGSITEDDLTQALRIQTRQTDPAKVELAYLERNGQISVISRKPEPQVFTVSVEDGVQTVRIELEK